MPIDINLLRPEKGGDPDKLRESEEKRYRKGDQQNLVDQVIELDNHWRRANFELEQSEREYNRNTKEVKERKKASKGQDPCEDLINRNKELQPIIQNLQEESKRSKEALNFKLNEIGNPVHESVPVHDDEEHNEIFRQWGEPNRRTIDNTPGNYYHYAVLARLDGYDAPRGVKLIGHRGYLLTGFGVLLNQALINYGLNFLMSKGYSPVQPPFFMLKSMMGLTAELADFDDQLYKVETGDPNDEGYYLIATSEQPISCMHQDEWIPEKSLPIRYAGYSSCFRKEAGAHGKDNWGIFRIHQFEKIEQFCITTPEKSWEMHDEMIGVAEEFYESLGIPYRVVIIVSGELNNAAAKKYDLEGWFPGYGTYRELVSCSNCTDYESRAAEVRCGAKEENDEKKYVHMLNATLCATERTLCCILENYENEEGLEVPEVLRPYIGGRDFIPYERELTTKEMKLD